MTLGNFHSSLSPSSFSHHCTKILPQSCCTTHSIGHEFSLDKNIIKRSVQFLLLLLIQTHPSREPEYNELTLAVTWHVLKQGTKGTCYRFIPLRWIQILTLLMLIAFGPTTKQNFVSTSAKLPSSIKENSFHRYQNRKFQSHIG